MTTQHLKLYHAAGSPNSRRVRMFLAEKGIDLALLAVDLGEKEQHGEAYRRINPRRVVPTLVLEDGTAIGEVPAIQRYLDLRFPELPLMGTNALEQGTIAMWDRRMEQDGFAAVMEAIRNAAPGLKERALAGPHDYAQIPALAERSRVRVRHFFEDLDLRLQEVSFVAGDNHSVADITALAAVDFAAKAINVGVPEELTALRRWHASMAARPSAAA
ncbi:MAG: glutathione S-transferase [Massilia sp.]